VQDDQWRVTRETVRRMRKQAGRQVIQQAQKRRAAGARTPTPTRAAPPHHVWSDDGVHAETTAGWRRQCLTVLDAYTREGLAIACARSRTLGDVVQGWPRGWAQRGAPVSSKSAHGPEVMAQRVTTGLRTQRVETPGIAPGSPWENGHHESLHGVLRDGCLNRWLCTAVSEARRIITHWREESQSVRPHGALQGLTPRAFAVPCSHPSLEKVA
jgi:putative transposase